MEGLMEFISRDNSHRSGYGDGSGDGAGYGDGSGDGYGYGAGDGYGDGSGSGDGYGDGYGYGAGDGYGDGSGDGYGDGDGSGDGYGLKSINGFPVISIDGICTAITHIRGGVVAKGFILRDDLTLESCYIIKRDGFFAHGKTIKEAARDVEGKILNNLPIQERIELFRKEFPDLNKKYPAKKFFDWHNKLTGSCLQGRESFCKSKGINVLKDKYTVFEFVEITKNSYNGNIIKMIVDNEKFQQ